MYVLSVISDVISYNFILNDIIELNTLYHHK